MNESRDSLGEEPPADVNPARVGPLPFERPDESRITAAKEVLLCYVRNMSEGDSISASELANSVCHLGHNRRAVNSALFDLVVEGLFVLRPTSFFDLSTGRTVTPPVPASGSVDLFDLSLSPKRDRLDHLQHTATQHVGSRVGHSVVMSLHGIRTTGKWQKDLTPILSKSGFTPHPLDYGWFSERLMLIPFVRRRKVDWFRGEYERALRENPGSSISIIAHSFGTYVVANALAKYSQIKFDYAIFCGAIVPRGFDWSTVILKRQQVRRVLNDYGAQDIWAWLSEWCVPDAGPSGKLGFTDDAQGTVLQQLHAAFRHSDHFYHLNYLERWVPFLKGVDPSHIPAPKRPPFNWRPWLVLFVLMVSSAALAWWLWRLPVTIDDEDPLPVHLEAPGSAPEDCRFPPGGPDQLVKGHSLEVINQSGRSLFVCFYPHFFDEELNVRDWRTVPVTGSKKVIDTHRGGCNYVVIIDKRTLKRVDIGWSRLQWGVNQRIYLLKNVFESKDRYSSIRFEPPEE